MTPPAATAAARTSVRPARRTVAPRPRGAAATAAPLEAPVTGGANSGPLTAPAEPAAPESPRRRRARAGSRPASPGPRSSCPCSTAITRGSRSTSTGAAAPIAAGT